MEQNNFSLAELQNWMQGMLIRHVPVTGEHAGEPVLADDIVNASKRLSAVKHLDIYRHSYIARLRSCMQSQFGALAYALGNELFELFADQYLDTYPSNSYTLNTLGEKFATFLEETRPDKESPQKETWPDFMIELADFEYALSVIFDQQADENYTIATDNTPDELLKPAPVLHLFHHQFPICKYYLDFTQEALPELPFPEESFCAVTRHDYKLGLFTIRGAQYHFLKYMQQGQTIEAAKQNMATTFSFVKSQLDDIWPVWKKSFIASRLLCESNKTYEVLKTS